MSSHTRFSMIKTPAQDPAIRPGLSNDPNMCQMCGKRPKAIERGRQHPYCGRTCARRMLGNEKVPNACALPGCRASSQGGQFGFCSERHARHAVQSGLIAGCSECKVKPRAIGELCVLCNRIQKEQTNIKELDRNGLTFRSVESHFLANWRSGQETPVLDKLYEVMPSNDAANEWEDYQRTLPAVKELTTYHSAQCICDLGHKSLKLCSLKSCGICNIVRSSFKTFEFNASSNVGRYGSGVYSYLDSSWADMFSTSCLSSPYRVMIVCRVLESTRSAGFFSFKKGVTTKVEKERVFVSDAVAIIPTYIAMYSYQK